jgi:dihydrofolate reductase
VEAALERVRPAAGIAALVELAAANAVGGPSLIHALWQRDAIDQLGLIVLPILFGEGLPLFPLDPGTASPPLKLVSSQVHPDGALELFYERP